MQHFTLAEFNAAEAPREIRTNIGLLCRHLLDPLRDAVGMPIVITSGYRTPERNRQAGGSPTSDHLRGLAADFHIPGLSPDQLRKRIPQLLACLALPFDQLILYPAFIHLSFRPDKNRKMILRR